MGNFQKKASQVEMVDPQKIFADILKSFSGSGLSRGVKYNLFYRLIAFKGISQGVGCSTVVANTALALADLGLSVCVLDTSILHPCQDELLDTNYLSLDKEKRLDWFDMPFTTVSPLNISKYNKSISVLSFAGKGRTILDMLSTLDSDRLVDIAISELESKFDVILFDLCDEPTNVNVTAMQRAQQVIQVWSDSVTALASMEQSITNNVTLSCPMDKMRYIVENKTIDDTMGNLNVLYKEYRFKRLSHCSLSYEIARVAQMKPLWKYVSSEQTIIDFNSLILDIVCHICGIEIEGKNNERRSLAKAVERNDNQEPLLKGIFKKGSVQEQETNGGISEEETDDIEEETVTVEDKKGLFGRRKNK